ncbi:hypothetical protein [Siphonobacter curvatus]|uniref:Lipocalin-like domain-containing protein n=1 Tax=Siphonobacter curvatus TaxID=2094562 RepID=A0A2S7IGG3_9BACT|nr:hypothetical protein [Siphonobacter curvatus]PQA54510.1 hypothetical protein C5O19_22445 [Siphonobacter curvatus]
MKKVFALVLTVLSMVTSSCKKGDDLDPATQSPAPNEVVGKWSFGRSSAGSYWDNGDNYVGHANEQSMSFEFKKNGTYECYTINNVTAYNCRTEVFSFEKGHVKFNEEEGTLTVTPTEGNFKSKDNCVNNHNFKRKMTASELKEHKKVYYYTVTESKGKPAILISTIPDATEYDGLLMTPGSW